VATTRRLAAIMFTDLAGFTKLGQRDEEAALALRREHQAMMRPLFAAHGGREVKTLGDGFLVEFPSAVESVRCAVKIQNEVTGRNSLPSSKERIDLRIGIHVGDVVGDGDDIVGDAVNVASRIEPLAGAGGILVSGTVFEQVRNKVPMPLEKLGPRRLKNVDLPVDIYRVVVAGGGAPARSEAVENGPTVRLAVLPFANLSPSPDDEFFADGLTDELIAHVAKLPGLRVIARTSILRYKGSSKTIREVAEDLGVNLALEGSVRRSGQRLRITAQLVDTATEAQVWSSRYDRPLDDIFTIQDDIAGQIATSVSGHLTQLGVTTVVPFVHAPPETSDLEAYTRFLHGRKLFNERGSEESIRKALEYFEEAIRRDPRFARARVGRAEVLEWLGSDGTIPFAEAEREARKEIAMALRENEGLAEAHSALAGFLIGEDDSLGAQREARRALELNPSLTDPYRWLALLAAGEGRIDEAVRLLETAQRLDPVDINVLAFLGRAYHYAGRTSDALAHWERTKPLVAFRTYAHLTEYYLSVGEYAKATLTVREMERLRPGNLWADTYGGMLAAKTGNTETARRALDRLRERGRTGELTVIGAGFIEYALGNMDGFLEAMEAAFRVHQLPLLELMYSPLFAAARSDPRLLDLLRRQSELGAGTD
jgi:adenylate cyclase